MPDEIREQLSLKQIFSTLGKSIREYKRISIVAPFLVAAESAIEAMLPFVTAKLIDTVNSGAGVSAVGKYGVVLIILAIVSLLCGMGAGIATARASAGVAKNLRHDMFASIQSFSFANIDHFSTSSLVTRLTTDTGYIQMAYMMLIRGAFRAPLMVTFTIIMAFIMAGPIAFIYVAVAPVLTFILISIALRAMKLFRRVFKKYDKLNESIEENVTGIRVSKSYVRGDYEKQRFDEAADELYHDFRKAEKLVAWNGPAMTICANAISLFVIYFGSRAIVQTQGHMLNVGQFSALFTYGIMILMSLNFLTMIFVMLTMSEESARRVCQVLIEKSTITNPDHPLMHVPNGSIDFNDVDFKYSAEATRNALSDIDLHIKSGETIGILGGTGSSKSSLVQLIARLYDVTSGSVEVGGHDVRDYDIDVLRQQVAMVLQRNVLFSGTIAENLRWGDNDATDEELVQAAKMAHAHEFIETMPDGYQTHIEQGGTNVSGGQKQRLCIARALLRKPKILILDDSTSAVDTKTDSLIRQALKDYMPETTKIIIAQRTASIEDADRIVVMNDGKIVAVGTHAELLRSNDIYRETFISQNKQSNDDSMEAILAADEKLDPNDDKLIDEDIKNIAAEDEQIADEIKVLEGGAADEH